jgi:hypothetical protein
MSNPSVPDDFFSVVPWFFGIFFVLILAGAVLVFALAIVGAVRHRGLITRAQWEQHELARAREAQRLGIAFVPNPEPRGLVEARRSGVQSGRRSGGAHDIGSPSSPMFPGN